MKAFTVKRLLVILIGVVLPVTVVLAVLMGSMRHSYLQAADSFGAEFGQAMVRQAIDAVEMVTLENQNSVVLAASGLPSNFDRLAASDCVAFLDRLAAPMSGRYGTFYFYGQDGVVYGSDGTNTKMHFTTRPDISAVLAGTAEQTLYGPVFEDDADTDASRVSGGDSAERSGYFIYYTVPLRNGEGEIVGAFSLRRDAYQYSDAIANLGLGEGGYTCLLNADGLVIAASRGPCLDMVADETNLTGVGGAYGEAVAGALAGGSGVTVSTDEAQGEATIAYSSLQDGAALSDAGSGITLGHSTVDTELDADIGWSVVTYLPQSELQGFLLAGASNDLLGGLGMRLAIILLVVLTVFYVVLDTIYSNRSERTRKARAHKDILDQTLGALAAACDARDVPDKGHGYRVAAYAREVGRHLDLTPEQAQNLYFEAVLHDIGQLTVPESILRRRAEQTLSAAESRRLREHVTVGGRILGHLTALPGINDGAMYHHLHYDGSGYCSQDVPPVRGDAIPMPARIIAVANDYDLQRTLGNDHPEQVLESGKGTLYDPIVADIMIQLIRDGTIDRLTRETEETLRTGNGALTTV